MDRTIEATTTVHAAPGRARNVLIDDPGSVLTDRHTADDRRARRFTTTLAADIGAGASLQQAVEITLDTPFVDDKTQTFVLPLRWHAIGHERLFPSFTGTFELGPDRQGARLDLRGHYAVPFGAVGRFGDGVAGRRVARSSLGAFLGEIALRLDREVVRRIDTRTFHPDPYPVTVHEHDRPEIHVG